MVPLESGEDNMTLTFLHESSFSGRAIGNSLMSMEKDIETLIGVKDYNYYFMRRCDIKDRDHYYVLSFSCTEMNISKLFSNRDPDLAAMELLQHLDKRIKEEKEKEKLGESKDG